MSARSGRRLRQRLLSPLTGEEYIKATPSPTYAAKKAALEDEAVRLSLELMEEAIVAEPDNWRDREQVDDVIWDTSQPGLALAYRVVDDEIIYATFIDLYLA